MKAFIDEENYTLITIGYNPKLAKEAVDALGLLSWVWADEDYAETALEKRPGLIEITIPVHTAAEVVGNTLQEQIQEDLITMMAAQFEPLADGDPGLAEQIQHVKDLACQIVVDNFNKFKSKE